MPPLRQTYASLDILKLELELDGGPTQPTDLFPYPVDQSFSVSPAEVPPHSTHYDRSQLSPILRKSSPLGPYQSSLPDRPIFPRSKSEPSLYRKALMRRFKKATRGREFFRRKKISASVTDAITKRKNGGGLLQVPATILSASCIIAAEVDWEVVDGMA